MTCVTDLYSIHTHTHTHTSCPPYRCSFLCSLYSLRFEFAGLRWLLPECLCWERAQQRTSILYVGSGWLRKLMGRGALRVPVGPCGTYHEQPAIQPVSAPQQASLTLSTPPPRPPPPPSKPPISDSHVL